jgi:hypothetical protein
MDSSSSVYCTNSVSNLVEDCQVFGVSLALPNGSEAIWDPFSYAK